MKSTGNPSGTARIHDKLLTASSTDLRAELREFFQDFVKDQAEAKKDSFPLAGDLVQLISREYTNILLAMNLASRIYRTINDY